MVCEASKHGWVRKEFGEGSALRGGIDGYMSVDMAPHGNRQDYRMGAGDQHVYVGDYRSGNHTLPCHPHMRKFGGDDAMVKEKFRTRVQRYQETYHNRTMGKAWPGPRAGALADRHTTNAVRMGHITRRGDPVDLIRHGAIAGPPCRSARSAGESRPQTNKVTQKKPHSTHRGHPTFPPPPSTPRMRKQPKTHDSGLGRPSTTRDWRNTVGGEMSAAHVSSQVACLGLDKPSKPYLQARRELSSRELKTVVAAREAALQTARHNREHAESRVVQFLAEP